jgi:hypothetical protein
LGRSPSEWHDYMGSDGSNLLIKVPTATPYFLGRRSAIAAAQVGRQALHGVSDVDRKRHRGLANELSQYPPE